MLDWGRTTRRGFTSALGAGLMGGLTLLVNRQAPAQKAPKQSVQYQKQPKTVTGTEQRCDNCQFYITPEEAGTDVGRCQVVKGPVEAQAWCNLWAPAN
jgi:hypothetical protein